MKLSKDNRQMIGIWTYFILSQIICFWLFGGPGMYLAFFVPLLGSLGYDAFRPHKDEKKKQEALGTFAVWLFFAIVVGCAGLQLIPYDHLPLYLFGGIGAWIVFSAYLYPAYLRARKIIIEPPPPGFLKGVWKEKGRVALILVIGAPLLYGGFALYWWAMIKWPIIIAIVLGGSAIGSAYNWYRERH